jgi:hypothetical protein
MMSSEKGATPVEPVAFAAMAARSEQGRTEVGRRPPRASRVVGYVFTIAFMLVTWFVVNVSPGWEAVPFLSEEVPLVLGLFNFSLLATVALNALYLVGDPLWLATAGELVLSSISLVLAWLVVVVFPFDFTGLGYDLSALARLAVVLALIGCAIAVLVNLVRLGRVVWRLA